MQNDNDQNGPIITPNNQTPPITPSNQTQQPQVISGESTSPQQPSLYGPATPVSFSGQSMNTQSPKSSKKLFVFIGITLLVLLILAVVYFVFIKNDSKSRSTVSTNQALPATNTTPAAETTTQPAATAAAITVNKSVKTATGFTITANKIIKGFIPSETKYADDLKKSGKEFTLVEVSITSDGSYTGTPGLSDFSLTSDGGAAVGPSYTIPTTKLKTDGYTTLNNPSLSSVKPTATTPLTGYILFETPINAKSQTLKYYLKAKVLGSSQALDEYYSIVLI